MTRTSDDPVATPATSAMAPADLLAQTAALFESAYVDPAIGERVAKALREKLRDGGYAQERAGERWCEAVTDDLRQWSADRHPRLTWSVEPLPAPGSDDVVREQADRRAHCAAMAQGVRRVECLAGGVGLIEITEFVERAWSAPAVAAAMQLVAPLRALIVDLRACGGGDPAAVALWCAHLLPERTELSAIVPRDAAATERCWADPAEAATHFRGPVIVLTANYTFSGAEAFAYDLQAVGRVQVVGERTGGGAHPCAFHALDAHHRLLLPMARALNPHTGSNWEGVGVTPDVKVTAADALPTALRMLAAA